MLHDTHSQFRDDLEWRDLLQYAVTVVIGTRGSGKAEELKHQYQLMFLQIASVPIALAAILAGRLLSDSGSDREITFKTLYTAVPQWLLFGFLMLNLLVGTGEVALLAVAGTMSEKIVWTAHAPLASMFTCSLAICVLYARIGILEGRPVAFSGRWAP